MTQAKITIKFCLYIYNRIAELSQNAGTTKKLSNKKTLQPRKKHYKKTLQQKS